MTINAVSRLPVLMRAVTLTLLTGCYAGPTLRYEEARPETATVLAGSLTAGAGYSVSEATSNDRHRFLRHDAPECGARP
jgi:hypothetical protein